MKYESKILEAIHENALAEYRLGIITESEMREYDELCLPAEVFQEKNEYKPVKIEHPDLVTA